MIVVLDVGEVVIADLIHIQSVGCHEAKDQPT